MADVEVGDLIKFSGEYYIILSSGDVEWILSAEPREGLVVEKIEEIMLVLSGENYFSVGNTDRTVKIEVLSDRS